MPKQKKLSLAYLIDKVIYLVGVFGVAVYIPQLAKVWTEKNVSGLSLLSWAGITTGSVIWLLYGIAHKQKPIVIINFLLAIIQLAIVLGIIYFS